jgi:ribose transport system substrate-binding protein
MRCRAAAAVLCAAALAAGCGDDDDSSGGGSAGGGSGDAITVGASVLGSQFPAVVAMNEGINEEAEKLGVEVTIADSSGKADKQANDIQDLIARQVDALIVNAVDSNAVLAPVKAARNADIPVIASFTTLGEAECVEEDTQGFVGFDEPGFGKTAGEAAVELLPDGGQVAIIDGLPGLRASKIRHDGFVEALKANPKIEVVASQPGDFDRDKARKAAENILQANPDVDLFFTSDDNMGVGAVQAIEAAGKDGEVMVIGLGGSKDALESIEAGKMTATVYSSLREGGRRALRMAVAAAKGEPIPVECNVLPQTLVDKSNIDEYIDNPAF